MWLLIMLVSCHLSISINSLHSIARTSTNVDQTSYNIQFQHENYLNSQDKPSRSNPKSIPMSQFKIFSFTDFELEYSMVTSLVLKEKEESVIVVLFHRLESVM